MPVRSQAQRAFLNAKFGHAWVKKHHFDQPGKLPYHVAMPALNKLRKKKNGSKTRQDHI